MSRQLGRRIASTTLSKNLAPGFDTLRTSPRTRRRSAQPSEHHGRRRTTQDSSCDDLRRGVVA